MFKIITLLSLMLFLVQSASAVTIKLGSLAPQNSPWDDALRKLSAEWKTVSKGRVKLKIYPGGIAGDEADMLRKMRLGTLNASALTGFGMVDLVPDLLTIQLPMLVETEDELNYILEKMGEYYSTELEKQGVKVLIWTKVGWLHFFSKKPVTTVPHLQSQKFFVYAGDPVAVDVWRDGGFTPVPLSVNDMMTSLQSGMVEAFSSTPLSTASYQWFGVANNMADIKWGPLLGGVIISKKVWDRFPAKLQKDLEASAQKIGAEMQQNINKADADAIAIMKKNGLTVTHIPQSDYDKWRKLAFGGHKFVTGKGVKPETYQLVQKYLKEYREKAGQ